MAFIPPPSYSITTPRLILRSAVPDDAEDLSALFTTQANFPFDAVDPTATAEVYRERIGRWAKTSAAGKNAFLAIVRRADNQLIGSGGFNSLEIKSESEADGPGVLVADTGIVIDHRSWRQGYAFEVLCATFEYGFDTLGAARFTLDTAKENEPWRTLMNKLGLGHTESQRPSWRKKDELEYFYQVGRADWQAARAALQEKGQWPL